MGFGTLQDIINENKQREIIDNELAMNLTVCPEHDWPLSVNSKGEKSCPIDGRIWSS